MLGHVKLHSGTGRVSVLKIMIKIAFSHEPHYGHKTPSALETHQEKSSEVIIPVTEHVRIHLDTGRVAVLKIMIIKSPISLINTSLLGTLHHRGWSEVVDSLSPHFS